MVVDESELKRFIDVIRSDSSNRGGAEPSLRHLHICEMTMFLHKVLQTQKLGAGSASKRGNVPNKYNFSRQVALMPPPQPGFFSYSDDTYSLEGINAGQSLSRRRPRASASSSAQQQHQLNSQQRGGHQLLPQHQ